MDESGHAGADDPARAVSAETAPYLPSRTATATAFLIRNSGLVKAVLDAAAWALAFALAMAVRYNLVFRHGGLRLHHLELAVITAAVVHVLFGVAVGLYRNHWRFGSFEEVLVLSEVTAVAAAAAFVLNLTLRPHLVPTPGPLDAAVFGLLIMMFIRYGWRILDQRRRRPSDPGARRVLVFGAGDGGTQLLGSVLRNRRSRYVPVALLDDNPAKRNLHIMGVRVVGSRLAIKVAAEQYEADTLIVAIPSAGSELIRQISDLAHAAGLDVRVLPPTNELLDGRVSAGDLRTPTIADLLGRRQVQTDLAAIAGYLTGRRVLVTGAGGSIGSELCRQLHHLQPAELIMVDRDESALHAVQLSLDGRGLLDSPNLVLIDIRDRARVDELFTERRPEVVFHAAALKHLPLLEAYPAEAVKSNVWGTYNILRAAQAAGVDRFVNISTDKAADPCSVLGYSKRIAERLTAHVAGEAATTGTYLSVRFGNVLGSRGSMLGAFTAQIDGGGPVSVTHPDVCRYFMTIEEAVQLVVQAGALGQPGEALVLDMGDPVRIVDVARRLVAQSGREIDIVFTGLRPGEKLHEDLFGAGETGSRPGHPLITHVVVPPLPPECALKLPGAGPRSEVVAALRDACQAGVDLINLVAPDVIDLVGDPSASPAT